MLFFVVLLLPIITWGNSFGWDFSLFNLFLLFPLLGLLTFSVVWIQVLVGAFGDYFSGLFNLDVFYARTGLAVLILFVSHPLVAAIAQLNATGLWPLESLFALAPPSHKAFLIIGMIVFVLWIIYEILLRLSSIPRVQKIASWWEHVADIGVLLIWYHGYKLGSHTSFGWFMYVWWVMGVTALVFVVWKIVKKIRSSINAN